MRKAGDRVLLLQTSLGSFDTEKRSLERLVVLVLDQDVLKIDPFLERLVDFFAIFIRLRAVRPILPSGTLIVEAAHTGPSLDTEIADLELRDEL